MIGIGVIGYGYWGPNLVRNFVANPGAEVIAVCDRESVRREAAGRLYPGISTTSEASEVFANPDIKAVAIATPVRTHFDLAMAALEAGKHVLVEKPMAETAEQGRQLIETAKARGLTLMVDHTFIYTGAVRKIRDIIESEELGEAYYYDSTRINLGLFQHDVNVLWDLAVHDLSILSFVLPERPTMVSATGTAHIQGSPENTAFLTLFYASGLIAHVNVNWLAPVKMRRTLITGSKKMIVYDDLEQTEKIKIYDKGVTLTSDPQLVKEMLIGYRTGDMYAPKVDESEALKVEIEHFLNCLRDGTPPQSGGEEGLRVLEILEAATQSLAQRGTPVPLD